MIAFLSLLVSLAFSQSGAGETGTERFGGLNDAESSAVIAPYEAQDSLNVESNLTGTAILKRRGYNQEAALTISTSAPNGSYKFIDPNGNNQKIVCHDKFCHKSTNGGAFSIFVTTGPANIKRWSFVDINGFVYGANDKNITPISYNGTTLSYPATMPLVSILELTKDRLAGAGATSNPNRIYYSRSGSYTDFSTGLNSSDPWTDDIGTPGDKITALKYDRGLLYVFKPISITACILGDQYTTKCNIISNNIGTNDPLSIVSAPDGLYFKAQDGTYWRLSEDGLGLVSQKISSFVKTQTEGSEQSNLQTGQSDWDAGTKQATFSWNTASVFGSIFPSSVTLVDTSSSDFSAGTLPVTLSTGVNGQVQLSTAVFRIKNGDFETGTLANWGCYERQAQDNCGVDGPSAIVGLYGASVTVNCTVASFDATVRLLEGGATVYSLSYATDPTVLTGKTLNLATLGLSTRTLQISFNASSNNVFESAIVSATFTAVSSITWRAESGDSCPGAAAGWKKLDEVMVNRYFAVEQSSHVAVFRSQVFDTAFSTPIGGTFSASSTTPAGTSLIYAVRSGGVLVPDATWTSFSAITNQTRIPEVGRYWQYVSSFTTQIGTTTPSLQDVSLVAATTGTYVSQCIQPGVNISSWGIISCAETKTGNASLTYAARGDAACTYLSTGSFTSQTNNGQISISTFPAMQFRFTSLLTSATEQAQVDACSIYWNNGVVAPPVVGAYDSIKNAIYWATAINNSATNNRILKYDLNLNAWYPFDLKASTMRMIDNQLYFGDSTGGYWNKYGTSGVDADSGTAINAYWKSKDFPGLSSYSDTSWNRIYTVYRGYGSGTMTATYAASNNQAGSYDISLGTTSSVNYLVNTKYITKLSPSSFFNVKFGNNAANQPFEIMGLKIDFITQPPRPTP